jgi:hypothetical protein
MDYEELPLSHLLVTLENYTHCRPLCTSSAEDDLYLAIIYGAFESLVRVKNKFLVNNFAGLIKEQLQRVDRTTRRGFEWLAEVVERLSGGEVKVQDVGFMLYNLEVVDVMKSFAGHLRALEGGRRIIGLRDRDADLQKFSSLLRTEICIYRIKSESEYERTEVFSPSQGTVVDIYQRNTLKGIETGLLYHSEVMKVNRNEQAASDQFPFTCQPNTSSPSVTACPHAFEPRVANSKSIPKAPLFEFRQPELLRQSGPPKPRQSIDLVSCCTCPDLVESSLIYDEVVCSARCKVCVRCMSRHGLAFMRCPKCARELSDNEAEMIKAMHESIRL